MKITHVVENLDRGGLERMVIDLAHAQAGAGHDVEVICLFERGTLAVELDRSGIPVHACHKNGAGDPRPWRRLRALLSARQDGALHTHNAAAHYHAGLAGMGQRFARIVNTRHGMGMPRPRSRREWLYRHSLHRTDAVVAVCEAALAKFAAQGVRPRGRLLKIANGIALDGFPQASAERREALASLLGFAPGTRIIGTVGRLSPVKDQAMLLRAFARVRETMADVALVVVGDGPLRAELGALAASLGIAPRVRFLGDRNDVRAALLAGFDLFALSSISEGYSVALLEACAAGIPIVATDVGGNGEIVADGGNGWLAPAGDADAFAALAARVLRDSAQAAAMGMRGREWARIEGSTHTMAARYAELYGTKA